MRKLKFTHIQITRWAIFIAAIALIYYFIPSNDVNRYQYEVNRPWNYNLLTAPFDIPIHLDSLSAQAIRDSLDANFEPVFYRADKLEKKIIDECTDRLDRTEGIALNRSDRRRLVNEIQKVYATGIMDFSSFGQRDKPPRSVRMIRNNEAISIPTTHFRSPRMAYAHLDSVLSDQNFRNAFAQARLTDLLQPNIMPDSAETERFRTEAYQTALAPIGVVQQGERIVDRGDIVTPQLYTILRSYEQILAERGSHETVSRLYPALGRLLFLTVIFASLYLFLYFYRRDYYSNSSTMTFLMLLITVFTLFTFGMSATFTTGVYIVPYTVVPIVVLVFLDSRTAFFTYLVTILLCTMVSRSPYEFMVMQLIAGITALASLKELSKRSELIRSALFVFIAYSLTYAAYELMQTGDIERISPRMFGALAINAVFISFAYILIFLLEKTFGFTSRVTLVELSDINHPLLRELSEECPGTFQHSMAVSNLATAAAHRIGANVQLVRTGALYHDIGKISNPAFFTENQHGVNPHDALSPLQSARIVIGHVPEGLKRAEKAKLPSCIRQFISEHHGKGKARFFYTTYANAHPGEKIDEAPFTYPGPNPRSRETSILMMADSVEAASRSLSDHSPEAIKSLVNKIIDSQVAEGLHNDSPLSFRDINEIKEVFASRLTTMYHSRISYPEAIKPQAEQQKP